VSSSASSTPPRGAAFTELEQLVRHLGEELSSFRRRALQSEARLKTLESEREARRATEDAFIRADAAAPPSPRVAELERENAELRRRLDVATTRTRQVLERVRFLRQQQAHGGER
jgi:small-conductance mechanosensitive channel